MEECPNENNGGKKRARYDSGELDTESHSPESKRVQISSDSDPNTPESDLVDPDTKPDSGDNSAESNRAENELDSPEVMKYGEDILDILDEQEIVPEIQDLDSVIRSFEEEIAQLSPSLPHPPVSGDSVPDLGYLLEASDDELGLPPTISDGQAQNQSINVSSGDEQDVNGMRNMAEFEHELPSYDSFELGLGENSNGGGNGNGDFVAVDGLFDFPDGSDFSDFGWRPESLPAL